MSDASSSKERLSLATRQYRKSVRMALVMGALAVISVVSHFVSILGAPTGVFPWWMTIVTVLLFGFTVMLAQSAKAKRDEAGEAAKE